MSNTLRIDQDSIDKYWSSREDARGFVDYLIDREHWTLDHNVNIAAEVELWASQLLQQDEAYLFSEDGLRQCMVVLAFITSEKVFPILHGIGDVYPSFIAALTNFAAGKVDDPKLERMAFIFLDRLRVANQQATLNQALGVDRLALVQHALKQTLEKYGSIG